jgi:ABC-type transport system substrate-binding protein
MLRRSLMAATLGLPALSLARPALAEPAFARTLRFVPEVGLTFLDPVFNIAAITNNHAFYVFDMLYALDSQCRARPQTAEGHTVSDDGLTWNIRLREGLTFHDGEKVRAIDCIASLRRWVVKDPFGQWHNAILSAVKQQDYLAAMMGGDASSTRSCLSMFPCGTPYGDMQGPSVMSDNPDLARSRAAIAAAGYAGEKIVILNPGDYPSLAALGEVTFDLFKRLGLNVELATSDWGSLTKRRASQDPVEKGGWSLYHTSWVSLAIATPATSSTIRGLGKAGGAAGTKALRWRPPSSNGWPPRAPSGATLPPD